MRLWTITPLVLALASFSLDAKAQNTSEPAYTADELVNFMVEQVDLGSARALCIGTKSECAASQPKPKGFDMRLTFDLDSSTLRPEAKANLEVVAAALKDARLRVAKFKVEGHTDARGSDDYNMSLSVARARSVADFLVSRNVDRSRIVAEGFGEGAPLTADPLDPDNRRVELSLSVE
ncbi:OmpA family protein [Hoeflea ulvae]|uniref:OmpA family protein n=1 Tax=Hoeflea ulvae TaxID=2983764 RepID=A0ABT3YH97_9HYPH|nr:OmpA family protein [Hoeflea ulvae]MCY0095193.1 OmpA family protein [Hoeflea ulvae]